MVTLGLTSILGIVPFAPGCSGSVIPAIVMIRKSVLIQLVSRGPFDFLTTNWRFILWSYIMSVRPIYRLSPAPSWDPSTVLSFGQRGLRLVSRRGRNKKSFAPSTTLRQLDSSQALVAWIRWSGELGPSINRTPSREGCLYGPLSNYIDYLHREKLLSRDSHAFLARFRNFNVYLGIANRASGADHFEGYFERAGGLSCQQSISKIDNHKIHERRKIVLSNNENS